MISQETSNTSSWKDAVAAAAYLKRGRRFVLREIAAAESEQRASEGVGKSRHERMARQLRVRSSGRDHRSSATTG